MYRICKKSILFGLLFIIGVFHSCDELPTNACHSDFDKISMLENIGQNIILPNYTTFALLADSLYQKTQEFIQIPDFTSLSDLRAIHFESWNHWQKVSLYEFGPAYDEQLRSHMNNFPVFVNRLEEGIQSGIYDLSAEAYSYARGFPALDYLLYGNDSSSIKIIQSFTSDSLATNRISYLNDVAQQIKEKAALVSFGWSPGGGNYLNTFTSNESIASGAPLSDLINQLNLNYEFIKNNKLGIPISAKTSYIPLLPENVEAYFSRRSLELAITAIEASRELFLGNAGSDSIGLDDFLISTGHSKGDELLSTLIDQQYQTALNELQAIFPSTLYDAINNQLDQVKIAYAAAQNQMIYTKTDMPAALCVNITYIDLVDDGD